MIAYRRKRVHYWILCRSLLLLIDFLLHSPLVAGDSNGLVFFHSGFPNSLYDYGGWAL